jgi:hypothetical protein
MLEAVGAVRAVHGRRATGAGVGDALSTRAPSRASDTATVKTRSMTQALVDADAWSRSASAALAADETLARRLPRHDLDAARRFAPGCGGAHHVTHPVAGPGRPPRPRGRAVAPARGLCWACSDHAGVVSLEWRVGDALAARWSSASVLQPAAQALFEAWERCADGAGALADEHAAAAAGSMCRSACPCARTAPATSSRRRTLDPAAAVAFRPPVPVAPAAGLRADACSPPRPRWSRPT